MSHALGKKFLINHLALGILQILYSYYGGHQTIFLNCFYDSVLSHLQKKGWLDITLNNDWDCNAFQFFAGDLFEMIPKLYQKFNPRQPLTG